MNGRPERDILAFALPLLLHSCAGRPALQVTTPDWERPRVPVLQETGLSAQSCAVCHAEIAAEWAASTHAHAWVDRQFQAELAKDPEVGWVCLNCHTPLANQQAELTVSTGAIRSPRRTANPAFDPALQQEGITCLSCHWREEGIAAAHEGVQAPHPTVYAPELRSEQICTGCHQAVARYEDALVCTFNTGTEWTEAAPGRTCPACHMPRVSRASAPGAPVREGGRHLWPGSLIPKDAWSTEEAALFAEWQPGIEATLVLPKSAPAGTVVHVKVDYANARAGHRLPTGDPERSLEIRLTATDSNGAEIGTANARIGQKWEWWPVARRLEDNRLAPGEQRSLGLDLTLPPGGANVVLRIEHVRLSEENAAFHKLGDYPTRRTVVERVGEIEALPPAPAGG